MKKIHACLLLNMVFLASGPLCIAQSWMNGYSYRKKITIDKSKVIAKTVVYSQTNIVDYDLVDFPVLIDLTDQDLVYTEGACGNKIQNREGKDISFALSTAPGSPLNFQLEHYDPVAGRLICWVKISILSANKTASPPTAIYLYYGSASTSNLHNPLGAAALNTWNADYSRVWHMGAPHTGQDLHELVFSPLLAETFATAKIGTGIELNQEDVAINSGIEESTTISISGWIKLKNIGTEQVILSNDSVGRGGYQLKINTIGNLVLDVFRSTSSKMSVTGSISTLTSDVWHHICAVFSGNVGSIYLNGNVVGSSSAQTLRLGPGGSVNIGRSTQGDLRFNGKMDEFRIQKITVGTEWIKTEYANQNDPNSFYMVAPEEYNPSGFYKFTGSGSQWNMASNWSTAVVPPANANVLIPAGKKVTFGGGASHQFNKLIIEQGAVLTLNSNMEADCISQIATGGSVILSNGAMLTFGSNVINDGSIYSDGSGGTINFSGSQEVQEYKGSGNLKIQKLSNEQTTTSHTLILKSRVQVTGFVDIKKGLINSAGNLMLLSTSQTHTAAILPVYDTSAANITGNVMVQQTISGNYPAPATARGWRLLSSPVFSSILNGDRQYDLYGYKDQIFVTGPGGVSNGFDTSPLSGATIYTHDQSLNGTLSQKYVSVKSMGDKVPLGKGIYVFSRGSRYEANAYSTQIQTAPFSNPQPYTLTHTGQIFTGNLTIPLNNRNTGAEGDGFNLIGNPYAAAVTWGGIIKTGTVAFIWQFDPFNNAYVVTDAPETIIPLGTAFFVRVSSGSTTGSLTFSEEAKYLGPVTTLPVLMADRPQKPVGTALSYKLIVTLSKGQFKQSYVLKLKSGGRDEITDDDAPKIGDGIVNICGLEGKVKLAIDERGIPDGSKQISLFVNAAETGEYTLTFDNDRLPDFKILLLDGYLGTKQEMTKKNNCYTFLINKSIPESEGEDRFQLLISPSLASSGEETMLSVFPNPFREKLTVRLNSDVQDDVLMTLKNILGKTVYQQVVYKNTPHTELNTLPWPAGIYLMHLTSLSGRYIKTLKVLKN